MKTTFALFSYVYKPLKEHLDDENFKIIYYSLEMSGEMLFAKLLSMHIFETYGIELSTKELLSRKKDYTLSDEHYNIVKECIPWINKVEKILTIYDKGLNSEILYSSLMKELESIGKFSEDGNRKIYTPNNENLILNVIIDHMSLLRPANGRTLKQEIDLCSAYLVTLRNRCKISPVVIMQANRESSSIDRRKEGLSNLTINDCKDSGAPAQDSEIILSVFNPHREKLASYRKYDIKSLRGNFRVITVIKSRYGESDVEDACAFYGKVGIFAELPRPDQITDYEKYKTIDWLKTDTKDQNINMNNTNT